MVCDGDVVWVVVEVCDVIFGLVYGIGFVFYECGEVDLWDFVIIGDDDYEFF